ncbi:MAG: phosphoglycerate mutase [Planctomycetota bacterium]|nr:MAG: phosphoglycerate mutase [Planctomycetota bacterium]
MSLSSAAGAAPSCRYRALIVILDGVGDRPAPVLDGLTPLEAAATPNLDALAARGQSGLVDPLSPGMPVDTHTGAAALMGVAAKQLPKIARGPIEAVGSGMDIQADDVLLRCNFATMATGFDSERILDRRAGRIREGTEELAAALRGIELPGAVSADFAAGTQHRGVLRLRGPLLSAEISDTDPGAGVTCPYLQPCQGLDSGGEAARVTAHAVNQFLAVARQRLTGHRVNLAREQAGLPPANGILTRNAGRAHALRGLASALGLRCAVVAGERTILGLASLLGYSGLSEEAFTSSLDSDFSRKAELAGEALMEHDIVFLHIKAPDICSHDLDPAGKRDVLMRIDKALAPLLAHPDLIVAVSGDHSTDSNTGKHCGDPLPTIFAAPTGRVDAVASYAESACAQGGLGRLRSADLFVSILDAMGALENYSPSLESFLPW